MTQPPCNPPALEDDTSEELFSLKVSQDRSELCTTGGQDVRGRRVKKVIPASFGQDGWDCVSPSFGRGFGLSKNEE